MIIEYDMFVTHQYSVWVVAGILIDVFIYLRI